MMQNLFSQCTLVVPFKGEGSNDATLFPPEGPKGTNSKGKASENKKE